MNTFSLTQVIGSCESAPNSIRRVEWDNFHPVLMPDDESHQLAACKGEAGLRLTIAQAGRRGLLGRMALGGQTKTLAAGWFNLSGKGLASSPCGMIDKMDMCPTIRQYSRRFAQAIMRQAGSQIWVTLALFLSGRREMGLRASRRKVLVTRQALTCALLMLLATSAATASPSREWAGLPESKVAEIANAIYRIEGGDKARVPYGILSVKVKSREDARRICCNTVRNNYVRWQKAGAKGDYRLYLADVYCPKSSDPKGNKNWRNNIVKMVNL